MIFCLIAKIWACLACFGHGRRLHAKIGRTADTSKASEFRYTLREFACLLRLLESPRAGWQVRAHGHSPARHTNTHRPSPRSCRKLYLQASDHSDCNIPIEFRIRKGDRDGGLSLTALLLQRAVQTQCFYHRSFRDESSAQWLAINARVPSKLHGIDGMAGVDWRSWLLEMLGRPNENITVETKIMMNKGWSPGNPYAPKPKPYTYTDVVSPQKMGAKVMECAKDIASEWIEDLDQIKDSNADVWRNWRAEVLQNDTEISYDVFALTFDYGVATGSPYRAGSYDLLEALATRHAVQLALDSVSEENTAARRLLTKYCTENAKAFRGELDYHSAESFLTGLLRMPWALLLGEPSADEPSVVPEVAEPRTACAQVLELRESIIESWIEKLKDLPGELLEVERVHLERMFDAQ